MREDVAILYVFMNNSSRCTQLIWSAGMDNPVAWGEFINRLKDGILSAFDLAIAIREDEVKRSDNQRQLPGWNFCTFFVLKVRAAINVSSFF